MDYKGKKVTVVGLGLYPEGSGISAVRFLYKKGAEITVTDLKSQKELSEQLKRLKPLKGITYILGRHRKQDFKSADLIVQNPGVPASSPYLAQARKNGIPIHNDITLFLSEVDNPIIGITGTRGKSTTAALAHHIISAKYPDAKLGGNIKVSPLSFIGKLSAKDPIILELSSWMLHAMPAIKKSPKIAVVTNIMRDHLNAYPSMRAYIADKKRIFAYQKSNDILILNKDDAETRKMAAEAKGEVLWFSMKPLAKKESGVFLNSKKEIVFKDGGESRRVCKTSEIQLKGDHNIYNVVTAIAVARSYGIGLSQIKKRVAEFKGLSSRLEKIAEKKNVSFYNDTTATTPDATIAALKSFDIKTILIAGGTDKKLDFTDLPKEIKKHARELVLLPGTATDKLKPALNKLNVQYREAGSMSEAVRVAWELSRPDDIILLSPGAASFGVFVNEFDRGEQFEEAVKKILKKA